MGGGGRRPLTEPHRGSGRGRRPLTMAHHPALAGLGHGEGAQAPRRRRANEGPLTGYGVADPGGGPRRSQCRRFSPHLPSGSSQMGGVGRKGATLAEAHWHAGPLPSPRGFWSSSLMGSRPNRSNDCAMAALADVCTIVDRLGVDRPDRHWLARRSLGTQWGYGELEPAG